MEFKLMKHGIVNFRLAVLELAFAALFPVLPLQAQWIKLTNNLPSFFSMTRLVTVGQTIYVSYSDFNQVICRSTDFGDSWTPVDASFPPSFNCSITEFTNSGGDLYIGTCNGIYKLTDGDTLWSDITGNLTGFVESILFKGNKVFVSTSGNGIFQTSVGDTNWIPVNNGLTSVHTYRLLEHGSYIYVVTGTGIFRSDDDGANWIPVNNGLVNNLSHTLGTSGTYLYAGTDSNCGFNFISGFNRSGNDGITWTAAQSGLPTCSEIYRIECIGNDIFVSGESLTSGSYIGIFSSSNNGNSWTADGLQWKWIYSIKACGNYLFSGTGNQGLWRRPYAGGAQLQGNVTYNDSLATPLPGCTVYLTLDDDTLCSTLTDSTGHFSFSNPSAGDYQLRVQSGMPWGGVNSVDALLVLKHFTGMAPLQGLSLQAANVDANGFVNAADALMLMKRFVGMISSYLQADWIFESPVTGFGNVTQTITIKGSCSGDVNASLFQ